MLRFITLLIAGAFAAAPAHAAELYPLEMTYSITPLANGRYHYDFALTLTNADGSWKPRQAWDYFLFEDVPDPQRSPLYDLKNCPKPLVGGDCEYTTGGRDGPTILLGRLGV